jgi:hypothetical protein
LSLFFFFFFFFFFFLGDFMSSGLVGEAETQTPLVPIRVSFPEALLVLAVPLQGLAKVVPEGHTLFTAKAIPLANTSVAAIVRISSIAFLLIRAPLFLGIGRESRCLGPPRYLSNN